MLGFWWLFDAIEGTPTSQLIGGMMWKGPLLIVFGAAGIFIGLRMLKNVIDPKPDANTVEKKLDEGQSSGDAARQPPSER